MSEDINHRIVALLPRLRAFARALSGQAVDADDLVQATCERALGALDGFTPGTRLDSWMFRIMRNHFIDGYRRDRFMTPLDTPGLADNLAGEDGRRVSEARLRMGEVMAAISNLPQEQREVLALVCVEGFRYREAAEILELPLGTVMSRLARARQALIDKTSGEIGALETEMRL